LRTSCGMFLEKIWWSNSIPIDFIFFMVSQSEMRWLGMFATYIGIANLQF
jgi:hypothetical protein